MRLNLASDLKTRTGAPETKDARLKNCYVEMKGNDPAQAGVRKRCCAAGGIQSGTGVAQGGIGFNIGQTPYVVTFNGDVPTVGGADSGSLATFFMGTQASYTLPQGTYYGQSPDYSQTFCSCAASFTLITDPADPYRNKYLMQTSVSIPLGVGDYFFPNSGAGSAVPILAVVANGYIVNAAQISPIVWGFIIPNPALQSTPSFTTSSPISSIGLPSLIEKIREYAATTTAQSLDVAVSVVGPGFVSRTVFSGIKTQPITNIINGFATTFFFDPLNVEIRIRDNRQFPITVSTTTTSLVPAGSVIGTYNLNNNVDYFFLANSP